MNKRGRIALECELYRCIQQVKEVQEQAKEVIDQLFPPGSRVEARLKHGQKKLSKGTAVSRHFGEPGYVCIEIDNAKPHSRQRFRDVYHTQIKRISEEA